MFSIQDLFDSLIDIVLTLERLVQEFRSFFDQHTSWRLQYLPKVGSSSYKFVCILSQRFNITEISQVNGAAFLLSSFTDV